MRDRQRAACRLIHPRTSNRESRCGRGCPSQESRPHDREAAHREHPRGHNRSELPAGLWLAWQEATALENLTESQATEDIPVARYTQARVEISLIRHLVRLPDETIAIWAVTESVTAVDRNFWLTGGYLDRWMFSTEDEARQRFADVAADHTTDHHRRGTRRNPRRDPQRHRSSPPTRPSRPTLAAEPRPSRPPNRTIRNAPVPGVVARPVHATRAQTLTRSPTTHSGSGENPRRGRCRSQMEEDDGSQRGNAGDTRPPWPPPVGNRSSPTS